MKHISLAAALLLSSISVQAETIYLNCTVTRELISPKSKKAPPPNPFSERAAWDALPDKPVWQMKFSESSDTGTMTDPYVNKIIRANVFLTPDEIAATYKKDDGMGKEELKANITRIDGSINILSSTSIGSLAMVTREQGFCKKAEPAQRAF